MHSGRYKAILIEAELNENSETNHIEYADVMELKSMTGNKFQANKENIKFSLFECYRTANSLKIELWNIDESFGQYGFEQFRHDTNVD